MPHNEFYLQQQFSVKKKNHGAVSKFIHILSYNFTEIYKTGLMFHLRLKKILLPQPLIEIHLQENGIY